jgi:hypothetical protein
MFLCEYNEKNNNIINKNTYEEYYKLNSKIFGKDKQPSPEFLTWLIGFAEGDGSFTMAKRGDLYFVIVQDTRDKQVLEYIKKELNMGKVIVQGKTTSRFIIQDFIGLYLITLIFNGQIRTPDKLKNFNNFVKKLNERGERKVHIKGFKKFGLKKGDIEFEKIKTHDKLKELTLNDNWLAGFTDAEGCFHVSFQKNNRGFLFLYDLAQKGIENKEFILDKMLLLFGVGKVTRHYHKTCWYYRVNGLRNTTKIIEYFDRPDNNLYTKKYNSYILWKHIRKGIINKEHLTLVGRQKLINLSQTVNQYRIEKR